MLCCCGTVVPGTVLICLTRHNFKIPISSGVLSNSGGIPLAPETVKCAYVYPDSKFHEANMGPIWGRQDPGWPHVGPMNFAIWGPRGKLCMLFLYFLWWDDNSCYNLLYKTFPGKVLSYSCLVEKNNNKTTHLSLLRAKYDMPWKESNYKVTGLIWLQVIKCV